MNRASAGKYKEITAPLGYGSIAILRLLVWTHRSPQRKIDWKKRSNVKKIIPDDVDNRWNYTLRMIDVSEYHKAALDDLVDENPVLQKLRLTKDHWKQLSDIKKVLNPFNDYTEQVSKKLLSIHLTIRMYYEIDDMFIKMIQRQGEYASFDNQVVDALKFARKKFDKYFDIMKGNDMYYIASVLDPRVKTRVIRKYVPNANEVIERIQKFLKTTYQIEPELPPSRNEATMHKSLEYQFLEEYESTLDDSTENDIDRYFNTAPVKFVLDKNIDQAVWNLKYWLGNKWDFPLMFEVARDYLAIAASEVDIERLFSMGRDILGVRRWALQAETMRSLTVLKDGLKRRNEEKSTGKVTEDTTTA